jgi:hypothetical protein
MKSLRDFRDRTRYVGCGIDRAFAEAGLERGFRCFETHDSNLTDLISATCIFSGKSNGAVTFGYPRALVLNSGSMTFGYLRQAPF